MSWVTYSLIMFVGSVIYYLIVKKVQKLGVSSRLYMVANSIVPALLYALLIILDNGTFKLEPISWGIVVFNALILNYLGSIAGYEGIKTAPNTGYSVIIQKSYAIWTAIVSVFLFDSELPSYKILGIGLILVFTSLVILEKNGKKFSVGNWFWYSLLAFFLFGGTTITARYIKTIGDNPTTYLFWVMVLTILISMIEYIRKREKGGTKLSLKILLWLILMSTAVSVFYWGKNLSSVTAPNVGYTGAINAASNGVLVIVSAIVFKDELKLTKLLAVIGIIVGMILLVI